MIKLGSKVKDKVSGLEGIAVARIEHLNGCMQYTVTAKVKKGEAEINSWNIDEPNLEVVSTGIKAKKKDTGGMTCRTLNRY